MLRQPVLVFSAGSEQLARARARALERGIATSIYTRDLFITGDDASNRGAVAAVSATDLDLVGVAMRGPENAIDRITKGLAKHFQTGELTKGEPDPLSRTPELRR